jgi:hypothetical protein
VAYEGWGKPIYKGENELRWSNGLKCFSDFIECFVYDIKHLMYYCPTVIGFSSNVRLYYDSHASATDFKIYN